MLLNEKQIESAITVWKEYISHGEKFLNASKEFTQQELDQRRRQTIPEVLNCLNRFLQGEIPLEEFKTVNDGINKRNRLWGFQAINGQMFFNVLTKNSLASGQMDVFSALLKNILTVPSSIDKAKILITEFAEFTRSLAPFSQDSRGAPKIGSIPFFLSYFWSIQAPDEYPIYYSSMVNTLRDVDIWTPSGSVADDYAAFYDLNHQLLDMLANEAGRQLTLWDVEHAFWFHMQTQIVVEETTAEPETPISRAEEKIAEGDLPDSYIPPIISILPRLANNDEALSQICNRSGKTIEKVFEERLAILFDMIGYRTELLGQGHGRVPDGIAICEEFRYAIIYDAKVRQQVYTMGTDERAIREYISVQGEKLRKRGMRNLYFMIISSSFSGDHDDTVRSLKIDMNVNEILLVEVKALLAMLEGKLRNPDVSLGSEGIQRLLASSGVLTESEVREFLEI